MQTLTCTIILYSRLRITETAGDCIMCSSYVKIQVTQCWSSYSLRQQPVSTESHSKMRNRTTNNDSFKNENGTDCIWQFVNTMWITPWLPSSESQKFESIKIMVDCSCAVKVIVSAVLCFNHIVFLERFSPIKLLFLNLWFFYCNRWGIPYLPPKCKKK